jgi:hypothetical protein
VGSPKKGSTSTKIISEAFSRVRRGRQSQARSRAIVKALRKAVVEKARSLLSPSAPQDAARKLEPLLRSKYRHYVRSYRVLSEAHEKGRARKRGRFRVRLQITLDVFGLKQLVGRLQQPASQPGRSRAVNVNCRVEGDPSSLPSPAAVSDALIATLRSLGYQAQKSGQRDEPAAPKEEQHQPSFDLAVRCTQISAGEIPAQSTFGSTVGCRAELRTAGGKTVLFKLGSFGSGLSATAERAGENAQKLAGAGLATKTHQRLTKRFSSCLHRFQLSVEGPLDLAQQRNLFSQIKRALAPGVQVRPVRFSRGKVEAVAELAQCRPRIIDRISSISLPSKTIRVIRLGPGRLKIEVSLPPDQAQNPEAP